MTASSARRAALLVGLASSALFACSLLRDLDELEDRAPSTSDGGGGDATSDAATPDGTVSTDGGTGSCPPDMVEGRVAGGARFCIDRSEVTQEAYEKFLGAKNVVAPQGCESNSSYRPDEPEPDGGRCDTSYDPSAKATMPVVCVDHCDATAYCTWRGRRLCSTPGGGRLEAASVNDPALDEWFVACAGAPPRTYATGQTPGKCIFARANAEPATSPGCATPEGVNHLSGNVNEWTDICSAGRASCLIRGGAFPGAEAAIACAHTGLGDTGPTPRSARSVFTGFRCCQNR